MTLKRSFDVLISSILLLLLSPVLIVIALCIWLDSGLPIFFYHERVGRQLQNFYLCKFRSMKNGSNGLTITVHGDTRITRVGRFLRATKLDELPQLYNVIVGNMSLVGPRPEAPAYVALYREQYARILAVRPGITDPASIVFRHEEQLLAQVPDPESYYRDVVLPRKLRLSLEYIENRSFYLDLHTLTRTLLEIARVHL